MPDQLNQANDDISENFGALYRLTFGRMLKKLIDDRFLEFISH
jgi:hypothetical protein